MTNLRELAERDAAHLADELHADAEQARREEARATAEAVAALRGFFKLPAETAVPLRLRGPLDVRPRLWEVTLDGYDLVVAQEAGPFGTAWNVYRRDREKGPEVETAWIPAEQLRLLDRPADLLGPRDEPDPLYALRQAEVTMQAQALRSC
jgi:hypothetical protein